MTKLHNIGKRITGLRSEETRGSEPYKMAGSHKLPTFVVDKPRTVKITRAKAHTHDPRFQCAPNEEVPELFGAYLPGVDPLTGKPWRAR
jgi:hypothetical protein